MNASIHPRKKPLALQHAITGTIDYQSREKIKSLYVPALQRCDAPKEILMADTHRSTFSPSTWRDLGGDSPTSDDATVID